MDHFLSGLNTVAGKTYAIPRQTKLLTDDEMSIEYGVQPRTTRANAEFDKRLQFERSRGKYATASRPVMP